MNDTGRGVSDTGREVCEVSAVCARLAQSVKSATANQEVPGSVPGLVEG